jgi:diadenosine tetraphosphate (Ap4A) HIT family hydrolase
MRTAECALCCQLDGHAGGDLIARLLPAQPYRRRVLLESADFAAIPSLGPLVPGHSLLCPKQHLPSVAALPPELDGEFERTCSELDAALRAVYGTPVHVFEHGMAASGGRMLCTVEHAHLHVLPLPPGVRLELGEGWTPFAWRLRTLRELAASGEYVLYRAPGAEAQILPASERVVESQHMRRVVTAALGRAERWDWRREPDAVSADRDWRRFALL